MDNLRITLIGKEDITRAGLEAIIRRYGEKYRIVAVYDTFKELNGQLLTIESDILLLYDSGMMDEDVFQFVDQFQLNYPDHRLMMFSHRHEADYVHTLLKGGNVSFVAKNDELPTEIIKALRSVSDDGVYLSRNIIKNLSVKSARLEKSGVTR